MTTGGPGRGYSFSCPPCAGRQSGFRYRMAVTRRASTCRHQDWSHWVGWKGSEVVVKPSASRQVTLSVHAKRTQAYGVSADHQQARQ